MSKRKKKRQERTLWIVLGLGLFGALLLFNLVL